MSKGLEEQLEVKLVGLVKNVFDAGFDAGKKDNYDAKLDIKSVQNDFMMLINQARRIETLLNELRAYIHIDTEPNKAYFILTRDIQGIWQSAYWADPNFYYAQTDKDLVSVLLKLRDSQGHIGKHDDL